MGKGYRRLGGSLTLRVTLLIVLFLVIPLVLHTIIIYVRDYQVKTVEAIHFLRGGAQEGQKDFSDFLRDVVPEAILLEKILVNENVNVTQLTEELGERNIMLLSSKGICLRSARPNDVGKDFSELLESIRKSGERYQMTSDHLGRLFFVSETLRGTYVVIEGGIQRVMHIFLSNPLDQVHLESALLARNGKVIDSTIEDVKHKTVVMPEHLPDGKSIVLRKLKEEDAYVFEAAGTKWIGVEVPLDGSDLKLLLFTDKRFIAREARWHLQRTFELFMFVLVLGGLLAFIIGIRMAKPMKQLARKMLAVGRGDVEARYTSDRLGFEINRIGEIFNSTIDALIRRTEEAQKERAQKEVLSKELILGGDIQRSTLPQDLPEFPELKIATGFVAAKEVGGDFYDLLVLDENRLLIVIADTAGKGLSAGMFSLILRGMLRAVASHEDSLDVVVKTVNRLFCLDTKDSGVFVTSWLGVFDRRDKSLTYTNVGHLPAFLKRGENLEELTVAGSSFGLEMEHVSVEKVVLDADDLLVLYTDGVIEAVNPSDEAYGSERLKGALVDGSVEHMVSMVLSDVKQFEEGREQHDDQTLLAIRVVS